MAFSTVPTVATSDSWTASQHNTYIKDNFAAVWVGTTAGDMDYYTAATTKARLGIGSATGIMYSTGSAPAWSAAGAAGSLPYSNASIITWLALGSAHSFLKSEGGSAAVYGALVYKRQGGSATNWASAGTTTYTPTTTLMQAGCQQVSVTGGTGSVTITYPTAFSQRPIVLVNVDDGSASRWEHSTSSGSTTGTDILIRNDAGGNGTVEVFWLAIGA